MPVVKDRKKLEKKAWEWFSRYIRLKTADSSGMVKCFTCGRVKHWKEMDAGHYKSQGHHKKLKFFEPNVRCQCTRCNRFLHGNLGEYHRLLVAENPDIDNVFAVIEATKGKMSASDFEYMISEYKPKVESLLKGLGDG